MTNNMANELIYGKTTDSASHSSRVDGEDVADVVEKSGHKRVVSARYKIYIIFYLLVGLLVFYKMLLPALDTKKTLNTQFSSLKMEVENFQVKKTAAENNVALLKTLEKEEQTIVDCINYQSDCTAHSGVEKLLTGDMLDVVKSFLNLTSLENSKMVIDEKKILENLNDFLLRKDIENREYNGEIEAIHIGQESVFDDNIYYSPIDLKIVFDNKDDLLSFVDNIEARVLPEKETRILYQIDNIRYDILRSQEKQSVDLALYMFYVR